MCTNRFRYFKTSREIICLAVMLYVRFPLSLRNVEDLLHERGINVSHETVRSWWNRFGPIFALLEIAATTRKSAISGSSGQFPPLPKRLASKFFHGATGCKVAINVEEVIDGGMNIQKALR